MKLNIQVDGCGWFIVDPPKATPQWESVTCDEMFIESHPLDAAFPPMNDVGAVRRHFQQLIRSRAGALISCDVVPVCGVEMVRTVSKYRTEHQFAMAFAASLTLPLANHAVELLIRGKEDAITGVREAIVTSELLRTAGPSEKRQLAEKKIPVEIKFERYEPGTQPDLCFVLTDDEKYDARFPDHPLTRVRRWLRRQERAFVVVKEAATEASHAPSPGKGGLLGNMLRKFGSRPANGAIHAGPAADPIAFKVRYAPIAPIDKDGLFRELGAQVVADSFTGEVLSQMKPPIALPPLATRQKTYRDQRIANAKVMMEQDQQRRAEFEQVKLDSQALLESLTAANTFAYLARERSSGEWFTIREGDQAGVLAVFTSAAIVDDFILCKKLACDPVQLSVSEFVALLPALKDQSIAALEFDRCPRCADVRPIVPLASIPSEGEFLRQYAARVVSKNFLVNKNLGVARKEADPAKRISILRYTGEHIDPGAPAVYVEIGKHARETGNSAVLENVKKILAKYSPADLALLDAE